MHKTSLIGNLHILDGKESTVLRAVEGFEGRAFLNDSTVHQPKLFV